MNRIDQSGRERASFEWVLLAYRLPREPSTPRITVWRKLKRPGVAQLLDGLVALPSDARTREQFEWIAQEVIEAHGTATVWTGLPVGVASERDLAATMTETIAAEYRSIIDEAEAARKATLTERRRALVRLRRELHRIAQRDHFPPPEGERARRAVRALAELVEAAL